MPKVKEKKLSESIIKDIIDDLKSCIVDEECFSDYYTDNKDFVSASFCKGTVKGYNNVIDLLEYALDKLAK